MGSSDSRVGRESVMSSASRVEVITLAQPGLSGSSTDLSARAVPYHPGKPDVHTRSLFIHRQQASPLYGGLATFT